MGGADGVDGALVSEAPRQERTGALVRRAGAFVVVVAPVARFQLSEDSPQRALPEPPQRLGGEAEAVRAAA